MRNHTGFTFDRESLFTIFVIFEWPAACKNGLTEFETRTTRRQSADEIEAGFFSQLKTGGISMRSVVVAAVTLLLAFEVRATTTTVSTGPQLQAAIQSASAGDTILLNDGTYTVTNAPGGVAFDILQSLTIRSVNGASHVTLNGAGLYIDVRIGTYSVTLEWITISGSNGFGVYVTDWTNSHGGVLSGVILRNLVVSTAALPAAPAARASRLWPPIQWWNYARFRIPMDMRSL